MVSVVGVAILVILLAFAGFYFFSGNETLTNGMHKQTETTTTVLTTSITESTTSSIISNFLRRKYYVNVSSGIGLSKFDNSTLTDVRNAFSAWQSAANNLIQFNEVNDSNADITVGFISNLAGNVTTITIGETYATHGLIKGSIQIVPQLVPCRNTGIVIHELGHIIGLEHNQTERSDIMYPLQNLACGQNISSYDVEQAKKLIEELIS